MFTARFRFDFQLLVVVDAGLTCRLSRLVRRCLWEIVDFIMFHRKFDVNWSIVDWVSISSFFSRGYWSDGAGVAQVGLLIVGWESEGGVWNEVMPSQWRTLG